jgi:hypothetical protein
MHGKSHIAEPVVNPWRHQFSRWNWRAGTPCRADWRFLRMTAAPWAQPEKLCQVPGSVNSISSLTHVAWLAHQRILGGWYGMEVVGAAAHVDAGGEGQQGGFGDLTVAPFILQWPGHRVFGMPIDQRFTADFGVPVGEYSRTSDVNLGSNAFNVHPYYSITAFPTKRIETSWRIHYLWNARNDAPHQYGGGAIHAGWASHSFQRNRCLQRVQGALDRRQWLLLKANH